MAATVASASNPPDPDGANDASRESFKERTIYIPYEDLRKVFEREGRGVFLPYDQFHELWQAARAGISKPTDAGPPVKAFITETESNAAVATDVVRVEAKIRIEVLTPGWHEVPLRLGGAAITSARIDNQPARIIGNGQAGYRLLLKHESTDPPEVELDLVYAKALTKSPGRYGVGFAAPQAPISRWRIPEPGVNVNIHPLIAATQVPSPEIGPSGADETVVLAFVGAAQQVRIEWAPKSEGAMGLSALVAAESFQRVWIDENVIRSTTSIAYDISRASLKQLVLETSADSNVAGVFDPNVRQWSVATVGALHRITVDLFEPASGTGPSQPPAGAASTQPVPTPTP